MTAGSRVAHLTSVHRALDARIFFKEARSLQTHGYNVFVIAQSKESFVRDGVQIIGVPPARGRFDRMTRTMFAMLRAALELDADVYHLHDPELIPLGLFLRSRGKTVIYDAHEDLPYDIEVKDWIPGAIRPTIARCAQYVLAMAGRRFNAVVTAVDTIAERFPGARVEVVRNFTDFSLAATNGEAHAITYSAVYCGSITIVRGIAEMVAAFSSGRLPSSARLALIGNFYDDGVEAAVRRLPGWSSVDFIGVLPNDKIAPVLKNSRAGLCVLHPTRGHLDSLPTKMFEYFAAGIPVIASDFPNWRPLVEGCGILVDPKDSTAIAQAIAYLEAHPGEAQEMGARARERVLREFNWKTEASRLGRLYQTLGCRPHDAASPCR